MASEGGFHPKNIIGSDTNFFVNNRKNKTWWPRFMSNSHLSSGHLRRLRTSGEGSQQLWRHCSVMSLISASPSPP